MRYVSTRGGMPSASFTEILLGGLAPDGGLTIPEAYPRIGNRELAAWRELSYPELAAEVISRFATDIPRADLDRMVHDCYCAEVFGSADVTPLHTLEPGLHLLELSNGPTLAFKDIAMQLLGRLFEYVLAGSPGTLNILGATSGDTGSSAEYAMRGRRNVNVFMLSPLGRMSAFQRAQMYSLDEPNIFNLAVDGPFDDCQDLVKAVSADAAFKARHRIGAVNSINWARITAQIVYYFRGYFLATSGNHEEVAFAVPSGNFGNVCAGHIARQMGLPIRQLIVATNENDVLDEFFRTGVYRPRPTAETRVTSSPSMDISKASNFERFVYDLTGRDPQRVASLWERLARDGRFDLSRDSEWQDIGRFGFTSGRSNHADRLATMREVQQRYGRVIDPHTADGVKVGREQRAPGVPLVCLETALPVKFEETVVEALGQRPTPPAGLAGLEQRPQRFEPIAVDVEELKAYIEAHAGA